MKLLSTYKNGNYWVKLYDDGTKIRFNDEDKFIPEFPECIDVNISNRCYNGCSFCYLGASPKGKIADFSDLEWLNTVHPYTELAININTLDQPLEKFLRICKDKCIIVNATINLKTFNREYFEKVQKEKLIKGIGISISPDDIEKVHLLNDIPNVVFHTIAGIFSIDDYRKLALENPKRVLVLGYKKVGRGNQYFNFELERKIIHLSFIENLNELIKLFDYIAFDNLALSQLKINGRIKGFESHYMGDDGQFTFYLDLVNRKFSISSTEKDLGFPMKDNVIDMFNFVRNLTKDIKLENAI